MERLFLFEHARRRGRGPEVELRLERDHLLRTGCLAQPALHAGIFGEPQRRALGIIAQGTGGAGGHTGEAERAARSVDFDRAERRAGWQRDQVDRRRRGVVQFAQRLTQHVALGAGGQEACRPGRAC